MRRIAPATNPLTDFTGMEPPAESEFRPPWPEGCPEPGIYPGVPYEEYKAWPAVNATALKAGFDLSALHMRETIEGHRDDTKDRKFGRATHCRFLEPQAFRERFKVAEPCAGILKTGERQGQACGLQARVWEFTHFAPPAWFCGKHKTKESVPPGEYIQPDERHRIERMWQSVTQHPIVQYLRAKGGCEVSLVWPLDGYACKARLDKLAEGFTNQQGEEYDMVLDLKKVTAFRIDEATVDRQIREFHYDLQMAWYLKGYELLTARKAQGAWIFGEDGPPFDVRPKWVGRWRRTGQAKVDRAFRAYKTAMATGRWVGVSPQFDDRPPPEWYEKNLGQQI